MKHLENQIFSIQNCKLKNGSKNLILGDGILDSPIMIVGGAPGYEETNCLIFKVRSVIFCKNAISHQY